MKVFKSKRLFWIDNFITYMLSKAKACYLKPDCNCLDWYEETVCAHLRMFQAGKYYYNKCLHAKSLQFCLTLCNPVDSSLPDFSVRGVFQARILEWVPVPFSRGSSWTRDRICISVSPALAGGFFTTSATWEAIIMMTSLLNGFKKEIFHIYFSLKNSF